MTDEAEPHPNLVKINPWQRFPDPTGRTFAFVGDVMAARGPHYVRSWLSITCLFQDKTIWTSDIGAERLNRDCSQLVEKHGIAIKADAQSRKHFREATAPYDGLFKMAKGKKQ